MQPQHDVEPATVTDDPYAPPKATIADLSNERIAGEQAPFYIVAPFKAGLLMMLTLGLYSVYWFWRHWRQHKRDKKLDIWPVPRAIFAIFFAHSLNAEIDHRIKREGLDHPWAPGLWATLFVVFSIAGRIVDRLLDDVIGLEASFGLSVLTLLGTTFAICQAQRAANIACRDPQAQSNRRLTVANYVWLLLGAAVWGLALLGLFLPEEPM